MKQLSILFLFFFTVANSQWKYIDVVDEFGDKVSETLAYISEDGHFSNTATNKSDLMAKISFYPTENEDYLKSFESYKAYMIKLSEDQNWSEFTKRTALKPKRLEKDYKKVIEESKKQHGRLWFTMYEYKSNTARFSLRWDDTTVLLKDEDGKKLRYDFRANEYLSTTDVFPMMCLKNDVSGEIWEMLTNDKAVKVVIIHGTSTYNFDVDPFNNELLKSN